jgi:ABC-type transporter Mla subunit MlaD
VIARVAAVVVVALAAVAGALSLGASEGSEGERYRLEFDNAFGIVEGADFRVGGVRVGEVSRFDLSEGFPIRAVVEVETEQANTARLRSDATCEIRPQSLIGEYYVNCRPGASRRDLRDRTVPVAQTRGTIPLDLVNNILRKPQRERLPLILNALGAGLAGRSEDVQEVLRRAHPGLRETQETLEILAEQDETIERFVVNSETVIAALARRRRDVVQFVRDAGEAAEVSASRRDDLARTFDRLPVFLAELDPTMDRLREVAEAQLPVLRDLRRGAPALLATFTELEPFAARARPALTSLGELSRTGSEAIEESREEIRELRDLADQAPAFARPLRQFLQSIDDRSRAIEPDPRAVETAPPAPDKTAAREGDGFTGMESFLNYAYWQTLAINAFDQVSHVLRFTLAVDECSAYSVNPIAEGREECVSWLGPDQPGVTTPDPTESQPRPGGAAGETAAVRRRAGAGGAGERGTVPADATRPRVALPDGVRELLDRLRLPAPSAPRPSGDAQAESVLDFLLAP